MHQLRAETLEPSIVRWVSPNPLDYRVHLQVAPFFLKSCCWQLQQQLPVVAAVPRSTFLGCSRISPASGSSASCTFASHYPLNRRHHERARRSFISRDTSHFFSSILLFVSCTSCRLIHHHLSSVAALHPDRAATIGDQAGVVQLPKRVLTSLACRGNLQN